MASYTYPYLALPERQNKPRTVGRSMVHDSGIGRAVDYAIYRPYLDKE